MEHVDVHFLNVGHGDCTFIDFPSNRLTMIDINNSGTLSDDEELGLALEKSVSLSQFRTAAIGKRSWEEYYKSLLVDPAEYFKEHFAGRNIFRYIQTHPDMDHMTGLCRFFWEEDVSVCNFWDTKHSKEFTKKDFETSPYDWNDWLVYRRMREGKVQDDDKHKVIHNLLDASGEHWTADGITVLSPTQSLLDESNKSESWNNCSYVLRLDYAGRSLILAGDAESEAWDSIESNVDTDVLDCDVLKAAHHGRKSGYSESATDLMDPSLVICSVGKKPGTDASDDYRAHGAEVLSTRYNGTLLMRIWADGEVVVTNHKGEKVFSLPVLR